LRHTSPIFSSDALHRTQKLAHVALNYLLFGLKTPDLNSYKNEVKLLPMIHSDERRKGDLKSTHEVLICVGA
jgi:hypothetical protein